MGVWAFHKSAGGGMTAILGSQNTQEWVFVLRGQMEWPGLSLDPLVPLPPSLLPGRTVRAFIIA